MQLEQLGAEVRRVMAGDTLMVVTDRQVGILYLKRCVESLKKAGFKVFTFIIPPGEGSKSGEMYLKLLNALADIPLTRSDGIVALGGGVVGDLAGFAAATYLRGIEIVQVPTTLLAAVDSSIGGKTAVNLTAGKNLAGAFHQPVLIFCDASLFETLSDQVYRDGMAEVIKYGVLADAHLFGLLQDRNWSREHMSEIIQRCAQLKKGYVEKDLRDTGLRQMLNLGHTIGHAIEQATGFSVSHGEAVAKGMARIADISARQGWCGRRCRDDIIHLLKTYGFDLTIAQSDEVLYDIMRADKKRKGQFIDLVVPEEIGRCRLQRLTMEQLGEIL